MGTIGVVKVCKRSKFYFKLKIFCSKFVCYDDYLLRIYNIKSIVKKFCSVQINFKFIE